MSNIKKKFLHGTAIVAAMGVISTPTAIAQNENAEADKKMLDVVVVTGIKRSLSDSIADKRTSGKIVDTINAEDIGRSTDQNIAEALNRVSGVSMSTRDGEGTTISVRGANADQTVVTLNGSALGSTGFSQGVDLSSYSADILSKVEVIKTPSADDEEGSLAAVVNLITRKPLEVEEDIRTFTAQGRYNDQADSTDYKLSGTVSQKFLNDRLGVIATAYDETNTIRRDEIFFENYNVYGSSFFTDQNGNAFGAQDAIDVETQRAAQFNRASAYEGVTGLRAGEGIYQHVGQGIAPTTSGYELNRNKWHRQGINLATQYEFTDKTDFTLNLTYNRQEFKDSMDGVASYLGTDHGHVDSIRHPILTPGFDDRTIAYDGNPVELGGTVATLGDPVTNPTANDGLLWTDPVHQWRTLDTSTNTWTKFTTRNGLGGTRASINNYKNENYLVSGELNHEFTDSFRTTIGASIAKSEQTPEREIFLTADRDRVIGRWNLHHVPAELIQPTGYDCEDSNSCRLIAGTSTPFLGNLVELQPDSNDLWDNIGKTGFNPDDLASHTLESISSTFTEVIDENTVVFADFDWDTNFAGLKSIEFGGKYTKREKHVDDQVGTPRAGEDLIEGVSSFTGDPIFFDPNNLSLIPVTNFSSGPLDADGFLEGLDTPRDNVTDGWETFDPVAAFETVTVGDREFNVDRTQTRGAEFENFAAYLKTNFSYLDDRLSGDIGVRYVKTEVQTTSFAGARFAFDSQGQGRVLDPIFLHNLRSSDQNNTCPVLSETPSPLAFGENSIYWNPLTTDPNVDPTNTNEPRNYDVNAFRERNRQARIDGLGTAPAVPGGICYDPILEAGMIEQSFHDRNLIRYSDLSTEQFGDIGGNELPDRSKLGLAAADSHEYEVFLPNLNLSYDVTDSLKARFSAYRTMSRPPIDNLRAGFVMNEGTLSDGTGNFRPSSEIDLYGAQVNPLKADNLDLSLEWYFQDDALLSVSLFQKDIQDIVEVTDSRWFVGDLRRIADDPENAIIDGSRFTSSDGVTTDLLLNSSADLSAQPDIANCMPRRLLGEGSIIAAEPWLYDGEARFLCNEYNVRRSQNAESASVSGVELQYAQNYSFLPGLLSGLGVAANYTYQDGSFDGSGFPIPGTPPHSYNVTGYWQQEGHQVRLAYSGTSDSLVNRSFLAGAEWLEGRQTLDLSAAYELSDNFLLTFEAQNLTDAPVRTYYTSRFLVVDGETFDEGSAFDDAPSHRTLREYNTGRIFRLGLRANF